MAKRFAQISYHVIVVLMSAALALSTPFALSAMAAGLLRAWAFIENEKIFLVALEIVTAVILILFFNHIRRGWDDRKITRMAKSAGLVRATTGKGMFAKRRMKKELGFARELMIIGSSGCRCHACFHTVPDRAFSTDGCDCRGRGQSGDRLLVGSYRGNIVQSVLVDDIRCYHFIGN